MQYRAGWLVIWRTLLPHLSETQGVICYSIPSPLIGYGTKPCPSDIPFTEQSTKGFYKHVQGPGGEATRG